MKTAYVLPPHIEPFYIPIKANTCRPYGGCAAQYMIAGLTVLQYTEPANIITINSERSPNHRPNGIICMVQYDDIILGSNDLTIPT